MGTCAWQPGLCLLCAACHTASVTAALELAREAEKVKGLPPLPRPATPPVQHYFLSIHLCSLFQAEEEWIQRLTDTALRAELALCFPLNHS